jgi:hypothetical protein
LSIVRACQSTLISCTFGRDSWIRTGGFLLPKQSTTGRPTSSSGAGRPRIFAKACGIEHNAESVRFYIGSTVREAAHR